MQLLSKLHQLSPFKNIIESRNTIFGYKLPQLQQPNQTIKTEFPLTFPSALKTLPKSIIKIDIIKYSNIMLIKYWNYSPLVIGTPNRPLLITDLIFNWLVFPAQVAVIFLLVSLKQFIFTYFQCPFNKYSVSCDQDIVLNNDVTLITVFVQRNFSCFFFYMKWISLSWLVGKIIFWY